MLVTRARDNSAFLAFCNLVGGQDELLFDGHSVVLDDEGEVLARAPGFEEALLVVDLDPSEAIGRRLRDVRRRALARERENEQQPVVIELEPSNKVLQGLGGEVVPFGPELEQMRKALALALRDYVGKNGFGDVVLGLSGGIDSRSSRPSRSTRSGRSACTASRCRPATRPRTPRATPAG